MKRIVSERLGLKTWQSCLLAMALSVVLAVASLIAAAFMPQSMILPNVRESVEGLHKDYADPRAFDRSPASDIDFGTDITMLMASAGTTDDYLGSILTNPIYTYELEDDSVETQVHQYVTALEKYANGEQPDDYWCYSRYWMGFRAVLRFLLVFLNYYQIKRYVGALFFTLFAAIICSIAKRVNSKTACAFALSVILVRPQIITCCLQFSCCFLIAFCAMLAVPKLAQNPKWEPVFFMEIGIVTMFFDFYTVPLVTFGLPLVYLYILRSQEGENVSVKWVLKLLLIWLLGYAGMWIAKLVLTTLLTSENAIQNGIQSFFGRVGITRTGPEENYSIVQAFRKVRLAVFSDVEGAVIYTVGAAAVVLAVLLQVVRKKLTWKVFCGNKSLIVIGLLPLAWFCVTAQPIVIHYYFQYRSIALTHWAAGAYLCLTMNGTACENGKI